MYSAALPKLLLLLSSMPPELALTTSINSNTIVGAMGASTVKGIIFCHTTVSIRRIVDNNRGAALPWYGPYVRCYTRDAAQLPASRTCDHKLLLLENSP